MLLFTYLIIVYDQNKDFPSVKNFNNFTVLNTWKFIISCYVYNLKCNLNYYPLKYSYLRLS